MFIPYPKDRAVNHPALKDGVQLMHLATSPSKMDCAVHRHLTGFDWSLRSIIMKRKTNYRIPKYSLKHSSLPVRCVLTVFTMEIALRIPIVCTDVITMVASLTAWYWIDFSDPWFLQLSTVYLILVINEPHETSEIIWSQKLVYDSFIYRFFKSSMVILLWLSSMIFRKKSSWWLDFLLNPIQFQFNFFVFLEKFYLHLLDKHCWCFLKDFQIFTFWKVPRVIVWWSRRIWDWQVRMLCPDSTFHCIVLSGNSCSIVKFRITQYCGLINATIPPLNFTIRKHSIFHLMSDWKIQWITIQIGYRIPQNEWLIRLIQMT